MHVQGPISCMVLRETGGRAQIASASTDGSCIIWDLATFKRRCSFLFLTSEFCTTEWWIWGS